MLSTDTTESAITIVYVDSPDEIYHRYRGQTSAQPCYVQLDCEEGVLRVGYSPHIGGGRSIAEHHRRALRWHIPALTVDAANALLDRLSPLAERVFLGYSTLWDGHNRVGTFDDDARDAAEDIALLCERDWREHDIQQRWEAGDWYADISRTELLDATGLTADTSDEQLKAIVADEMMRAFDGHGILVDGVDRYFEWLRDKLREDAAVDDEDNT
jgi:hypothetical protein